MKTQNLLADCPYNEHFEERPLGAINKIVCKGSIDLIIKRGEQNSLIVAGNSAKAVNAVTTTVTDGKLKISNGGPTIVCYVRGGITTTIINGCVVENNLAQLLNESGSAIILITTPVIPKVKIKGSGDVLLLDVRQERLEIEIEGSGSIEAKGAVDHLDAKINGSGDIEAAELIAATADVSLYGTGDIETHVVNDFNGKVYGTGDILVHGNPRKKADSVFGTGRIRFK